MAVYKVEICGVNTAKLPILSEDEKTELFSRIKQGDRFARNNTSRKSPPRFERDQTLCKQ